MKFFDVIPYGEAVEIAEKLLRKSALKSIEKPLEECLGYVIAADIYSKENLPSFDKSTVDGYAVKAANTFGASDSVPALLTVIGKVEMGKSFLGKVENGEAVYIPTGGKLPTGADAVVMIENCEKLGENIAVWKSVPVGGNVFHIGADIALGEKVAHIGQELTPLIIGVLAGLGERKVQVFDKIKFGIISTGDEIVGINDTLSDGMIRDINSYTLSALAHADGHIVSYQSHCPDVLERLMEETQKASDFADIILISGGSSVGEKDFTFPVIEKICSHAAIKGIALKPGKPTIAGGRGTKTYFGLPGHPMAAASVYEILISKAVRNLRTQKEKTLAYAKAKTNFPSSPGRTTCQPIKLIYSDSEVLAEPIFSKSGALNALSVSDGYVLISADEEGVYAGQTVEVKKFGR